MSDLSTYALVSPALASELSYPAPRLGVMASGRGSNLEAVAKAIASGSLQAEIAVLIYNNPDAKAADLARSWQIPAVLCNHRHFKTRQECDGAIVEILQRYGVDWVVMAGWMRVATTVLVDAFRDRIINIHPSLLPSFKGVRAVEQALAAGVKITGCTVHLVRLEVDSGPILIQAAVPILPEDTPETLHQRIQVQEHRILPKAIALAVAGNVE